MNIGLFYFKQKTKLQNFLKLSKLSVLIKIHIIYFKYSEAHFKISRSNASRIIDYSCKSGGRLRTKYSNRIF